MRELPGYGDPATWGPVTSYGCDPRYVELPYTDIPITREKSIRVWNDDGACFWVDDEGYIISELCAEAYDDWRDAIEEVTP